MQEVDSCFSRDDDNYFSVLGRSPGGQLTWFYDNELYSPDCRFAVFVDTNYPSPVGFRELFDQLDPRKPVPEIVVIKRVYGEPADFIPYCREGKVAVEHFADLEIASNYAKLLALELCLKIELMLK